MSDHLHQIFDQIKYDFIIFLRSNENFNISSVHGCMLSVLTRWMFMLLFISVTVSWFGELQLELHIACDLH